MTINEYQKFCQTTALPAKNKSIEIMTYGLGVAGEAGDLAGCIKKTYAHKDDQMIGIKENLGDTMWYIAQIASFYGWKMDDILKMNVDKLKKRYEEGVTFKAAAKRKRIDWNE